MAFAAITIQAQDRKVIADVFSALTVKDTTYTLTMDGNYRWGFQLVWTGGTGTLDGTVTIQVSNYPTTNFVTYATNSTTTLSSAAGNWTFEDTGLTWKYWRVEIVDNNMTGGTLNGKIIRMKN